MTSPLRFETGGILARHASILDALADSFSIRAPSKLTSLSLKNLRTCDLTSLESSSFQAVLKNLRRLQLYMNHDRAEGIITSSDESDPCLPFWGTLFRRWSSTQHSTHSRSLHWNATNSSAPCRGCPSLGCTFHTFVRSLCAISSSGRQSASSLSSFDMLQPSRV